MVTREVPNLKTRVRFPAAVLYLFEQKESILIMVQYLGFLMLA